MARRSTGQAKKRARKPEVGEALIESFSEAVAWARGEIELPVREYQPPESVEVDGPRGQADRHGH